MKKATKEWVCKAEADYLVATKIARGSDPLHDAVCFHCQQCAEKYLKGLMEELGVTVPRTHVLKDLLALLRSHHPSLGTLRRGLTFLTRFAVNTRYLGDSATKRQAGAAVRWAGRVRGDCRSLLGLRTARKKGP